MANYFILYVLTDLSSYCRESNSIKLQVLFSIFCLKKKTFSSFYELLKSCSNTSFAEQSRISDFLGTSATKFIVKSWKGSKNVNSKEFKNFKVGILCTLKKFVSTFYLKNYADLIIDVLKTLMTSCNYLWPVFSAMVYYEDSYYF